MNLIIIAVRTLIKQSEYRNDCSKIRRIQMGEEERGAAEAERAKERVKEIEAMYQCMTLTYIRTNQNLRIMVMSIHEQMSMSSSLQKCRRDGSMTR